MGRRRRRIARVAGRNAAALEPREDRGEKGVCVRELTRLDCLLASGAATGQEGGSCTALHGRSNTRVQLRGGAGGSQPRTCTTRAGRSTITNTHAHAETGRTRPREKPKGRERATNRQTTTAAEAGQRTARRRAGEMQYSRAATQGGETATLCHSKGRARRLTTHSGHTLTFYGPFWGYGAGRAARRAGRGGAGFVQRRRVEGGGEALTRACAGTTGRRKRKISGGREQEANKDGLRCRGGRGEGREVRCQARCRADSARGGVRRAREGWGDRGKGVQERRLCVSGGGGERGGPNPSAWVVAVSLVRAATPPSDFVGAQVLA